MLLPTTGCHREHDVKPRDTTAVARDNIVRDSAGTTTGDTVEVAGEVVDDSADRAPAEKWIFDPNVLSLLYLMNGRQIAAAEIELEEWHSDTVRVFASQMMHDHAALQRSIDSLVERLNMAPVRPAIAAQIGAAFQAQIDSMVAYRSGPRGSLDRAFVRQQVAGHALMASYIQQLAGVAERPELRALLSSAATVAKTELARARGMQARLPRPTLRRLRTASKDAARRKPTPHRPRRVASAPATRLPEEIHELPSSLAELWRKSVRNASSRPTCSPVD